MLAVTASCKSMNLNSGKNSRPQAFWQLCGFGFCRSSGRRYNAPVLRISHVLLVRLRGIQKTLSQAATFFLSRP